MYEDGLPPELFTKPQHDPNRREKVEDGQTSFFDGQEFRTFKEFTTIDGSEIPNGATYVIKAVVPVDLILFGIELILDSGHLRMQTLAGGAEGGAFAEVLPIFNRNNMSTRPLPLYLPQVVLTAGGTHTGGTVLDPLRLKVANATGNATSVGNSPEDQRGIAAGTYYFRLANIGTGVIEGTFKARWREVP